MPLQNMAFNSSTKSGAGSRISKVEWNRVAELAANIVNQTRAGKPKQSRESTRQLLEELRRLKQRYPDDYRIEATTADYVWSLSTRAFLLRKAYRAAALANDGLNMGLTAVDLADISWKRKNFVQAALWLRRALKHQKKLDDPYVSSISKLVESRLRRRRTSGNRPRARN